MVVAEIKLKLPKAPMNMEPSKWTWNDVIWYRVIILIYLHFQLPWSLYVLFCETSVATSSWSVFVMVYGAMGAAVGAHRLWSHRSFKAKPVFHWITMICYSANFNNYMGDVIDWVTVHRTHHLYADTEGDPVNARRGFFYAHVGWLLLKDNETVKRAKADVDVGDLWANPALVFNRRHNRLLTFIFLLLVPICIPFLWGERFWVSYNLAIFRCTYSLHATGTIHSLAHLIGTRPYDANLGATQNVVATVLTLGEGWHNYHHAFPYDYRASEFPWLCNLWTVLIDFSAWLGLVYDRQTVSPTAINNRKLRTGEIQPKKQL